MRRKKRNVDWRGQKKREEVTVFVLLLSLVFLTLTFSTTATSTISTTFFIPERGVLFDRTVFFYCVTY